MEKDVFAICKILKIDPPTIELVDKFDPPASATMRACYVPDDDIVYIKRGLDEVNTIFVLAHELRHVYQYELNGRFAHKNSTELSIDAYNEQPEEIDANAFAVFYLLMSRHVLMDLKWCKPATANKILSGAAYFQEKYDKR